jgi:serine protease Do
MAKYFGLSDKNGVLVAKVLENGPAQKSGIKESDIIKQFDNKPVNNVRELLSVVGKAEVGRKVKVVVVRDKREVVLEVLVGERPQEAEETSGVTAKSASGWRGLRVEDLTPGLVKRFGIEDKRGVIVTEIEPNSPAEQSGISLGDVIVEINRFPVDNISDYNRITKDLKGDALIRTTRGYLLLKSSE